LEDVTMKKLDTLIAAATLIACLGWAPAAQTGSEVLAVRAGALIDGTGAAPARNVTILIENGRITRVGAGIAVPPGARTIDLSNRTVLPGRSIAWPPLEPTTRWWRPRTPGGC
jgi:cytosine/adenosine deaminase-related metal-dependent hydrolase